MKTFTLGQVLTVTTGCSCVKEFGQVYEILDYLLGVEHYTHQIPRAMRICRPWLLEKHPELQVDVSDVTPDNFDAWMEKQAQIFPATYDLEQIPNGPDTYVDPVAEMVEMMGSKPTPEGETS